jgi:biopolymer transport protein ExbB/TolQ
MANSANHQVLASTRRAAERAAAIVRGELACGTVSLLAIGCIAPLLGIFGTAVLLIGALRAQSLPGFGECDCAGGVAETFVPFALSLPLAIFALWGFHCMRHQVERFGFEMRIATLNLLFHLEPRQIVRR